MRKWIYDRPWIWVVLFLATLIGASLVTVIIAEVNKPEIVKPKAARRGAASSLVSMAGADGPGLRLAASPGCP